jgi:type II secretory pathway predicted ATPase ExeA
MHCVALLERDEMLDALDGHLPAALRDEGRLVLVTGEAGVGKSALAQAFAARHEAVRVAIEAPPDANTMPR